MPPRRARPGGRQGIPNGRTVSVERRKATRLSLHESSEEGRALQAITVPQNVAVRRRERR